MSCKSPGFALMEMLVSGGLLVVLSAMRLPAIAENRDAAKRRPRRKLR